MNGTGGGAPADEEATGYPMENALNSSRKIVWQTSAAPVSPTQLDIDLGAATICNVGWINGLRYSDTSKVLSTVKIYKASSYPTFTLADEITIPAITAEGEAPRDAGKAFNDPWNLRYWRFEFTFSGSAGAFTIGKIGLGVISDLGVYYAAGSEDTPTRFQAKSQTLDGCPEINDYGDPGRNIRLIFPTVDSTLKAKLVPLARLSGSFIYIDPADNFYEVVLADSQVPFSRVFTSLDYSELNLTRLP